MNAELTKKLYTKYPKIFRQKDLSMQETCMCWGLACGDGWYDLLDDLCKKIQVYINKHNEEQVEAMQVKEKFGGLRFYVCGAPGEVYDYIHEAENESYNTCEACGTKEEIGYTTGWVSTLCRTCAMKDDRTKDRWRPKDEK